MTKNLSLIVASVAALALAVPPLASASPTATNTASASLPSGTKIRLTAITTKETPKFTSTILGTIECNALSITGTLNTNTGGTVTGSSGGEFSSTTCTNKGNPVTITSLVVSDLVTTVSGKATASYTSVTDVAGQTCTYTATSIPGTYTLGTDILKFNKAGTIDGSPAGCGTTTLDAEFTMEYEDSSTHAWHAMIVS